MKTHARPTFLFLLVLAATSASARAQMSAPSDSAAVVAVAEQFREAITAGDAKAAGALLTHDVAILEGGKIETAHDYLSHHFLSDGPFLRAMTREPGERRVTVAGDAAWVVSRSRLHGAYRDRDIDMNSVELMVLRRTDGGWRIAAVHWSSGRR